MISYKQHSLDDRWDAIVIGSGIGGLTTAALLSKYAAKKVSGAGAPLHRRRLHPQLPSPRLLLGRRRALHRRSAGSRRLRLRAAFDHLTGGQLEWAPMPDVYDRVDNGRAHVRISHRTSSACGLA